ncbi:hypothetical protein S245_035436 [Arachis hypogaea]
MPRFGLVVLVVVVVMGMISRGESIRDLRNFKYTFESQLPKGPVPPSGPSACHNKLGPYKYNNVEAASFPNDYYIICP